MDVRQEQDGVWKTLFHRQTPQVEAFACQEYLDGSATLRLPDDRVPSLDELESAITPRTGWRLRRTPVRYSDALPWYRHFHRKIFLVTDYMRSKEELDFTPEPAFLRGRNPPRDGRPDADPAFQRPAHSHPDKGHLHLQRSAVRVRFPGFADK